ncbi:hypothetical protein A3C86_01520 [Candidatus Kaiserbacteria bacterium RIFCSPHIGHO2_02_FULL_49_16]|uniref:UDP-glucose/GDP-mannose dehydrogenase dimerisation domain-containing protein n=1 Tax=Candidatus Kaiserbacteria bacterium RIFCSPHIGHO2_02_FULL_49_16 TaxID=1798490 RepID=A0A1F6DE49_9BACT|nr:MAG: hypothetical protein A3C86_01520 [Candidatus Kaiserbacteria bacterium RIFCSPHIGHO2_02_FULL_49_16]
MKVSEEKYVIVGFGWVGQANAIALTQLGYDVSYFDPGNPSHHYAEFSDLYKKIEPLSSLKQNDARNTCYMVCVGDKVSEEGEQDISNIKTVLASLRGAKGGVMLRSTILPGLLEELNYDWYVPEFLHEKKAVEECLDPFFFVIGKKDGARPEPSVCALWQKRAGKTFSGTAREASLIKYLSNLWNSTRIAFVNEFGDAIGRPTDKKRLVEIERVIDFLFDHRMYMRYGRAFSGHCLPKDTRAFRSWYEKNGTKFPLIAGVYESNSRHAQLEKELPLLPEWYSEWPDRHISGWRALSELLYAIRKNVAHPLLAWKRMTGGRK